MANPADPLNPRYSFGRDPVMQKLMTEMRTSSEAVSVFATVKSPAAAARLLDRLKRLSEFGVTEAQLKSISGLLDQIFGGGELKPGVERRLKLSFKVAGERRQGLFRIKFEPEWGFPVQVALPGIVASSAQGFLANEGSDDGFVTEFLPPSFYSSLP